MHCSLTASNTSLLNSSRWIPDSTVESLLFRRDAESSGSSRPETNLITFFSLTHGAVYIFGSVSVIVNSRVSRSTRRYTLLQSHFVTVRISKMIQPGSLVEANGIDDKGVFHPICLTELSHPRGIGIPGSSQPVDPDFAP
mgnify:CR=1 FL=1